MKESCRFPIQCRYALICLLLACCCAYRSDSYLHLPLSPQNLFGEGIEPEYWIHIRRLTHQSLLQQRTSEVQPFIHTLLSAYAICRKLIVSIIADLLCVCSPQDSDDIAHTKEFFSSSHARQK